MEKQYKLCVLLSIVFSVTANPLTQTHPTSTHSCPLGDLASKRDTWFYQQIPDQYQNDAILNEVKLKMDQSLTDNSIENVTKTSLNKYLVEVDEQTKLTLPEQYFFKVEKVMKSPIVRGEPFCINVISLNRVFDETIGREVEFEIDDLVGIIYDEKTGKAHTVTANMRFELLRVDGVDDDVELKRIQKSEFFQTMKKENDKLLHDLIKQRHCLTYFKSENCDI